jgi:hypothetical protein
VHTHTHTDKVTNESAIIHSIHKRPSIFYLSVILPGKLTENTFSFAAMTWGIVAGERRGMNEPNVNWGLLGDRDGLRARLGI